VQLNALDVLLHDDLRCFFNVAVVKLNCSGVEALQVIVLEEILGIVWILVSISCKNSSPSPENRYGPMKASDLCCRMRASNDTFKFSLDT
jgi:hypothetical protein